jgi:CheY-like chemotaxis protein
MPRILIFDSQKHRREHLVSELEKEGYDVKAISEQDFDPAKFDCSPFDMAVLNLYPDAMRTWEIYYDFRKYFPGFPVLVYLIKNIFALRCLKISIKDILNEHPPYRLSKNKFHPSLCDYTGGPDLTVAKEMNWF